MRRLLYLLIWLLLPSWLLAQTNISAVEYWYDSNYSTANRQAVTPGASVVFTDLIDVSALDPGLHTFAVRFQDTRGVWGSVLPQFFTYYPEASSGIQWVTDAEYWYDGNYSTLVQTPLTPGTSTDLNDLLDVSSLDPGLHTYTVRFKDTRGIWSSVLTRFFTYYPEASAGVHEVTDAEYWYDGNYAAAVKTSLTPGVSADLSSLLDVSALIKGLHTVTFRFKDDRGIWSSPLIRFFKIETSTGLQQMVALEYWFNNDYANKVSSTFAATSLFSLNEMLDVSSLNEGFHIVSVRLQDESGRWNAPASWFFTKELNEALPQLHQLTGYEYWYDGDYSNVQNNPVPATSLLAIDADLDVSALTNGLHMLSSRYRDEAGNWSPVHSSLFAKYPDEAGAVAHKITELEYWFDGDYSNVHNDPVPGVAQLDLNNPLDVSALSDGLHLVSTRYRDEAGNWSPAFSHLFSKFPGDPVADLHELVSVEYWIDGDIGSKLNSALTPGAEYVLNTQLDVSALSQGLHSITYRFEDETGNWSSGITHLFSNYNDEVVTADNKITGYRYWPDNLMASSVEVSLTTPLKSLLLDELIDVSHFPGGEHLASFQFQDELGQWSSAISQTYSKEVQPTLSISASDSTVCAGSTVSFTADYFDADAIEWKFGDGGISNEFSPYHTYGGAGVFEVTAIVTHTDSMKSAFDTIVGGITVYPTYYTSLGGTDTIFHDSFENETINTAPSEWTLKYNGTGTANQIVVGNPVKNGSLSYQLEGASGWAAESFKRFTNLPEKVIVEAWINCEKTLSGITGSIGVGNFDVGSWGTRTSRLEFNAGKFVATYTGGSSYTIMDYTPGMWYHIRMVHDLVNLTYQVYINNVLVSGDDGSGATNIFPMHPSISTQDVMLCAGNSGVTKVFFEDIVVEQEGVLEVCASSLPFVLGAQSITTEGFYTETFASEFGCDSVVSVNLIINPSGSSTQYDTICESELPYSFGTQTLFAGGTYVENIPTGAGCDSTVTLNLVVKDSSVATDAQTICETELPFLFGSSSLTSSGVYTEIFTAANGCDSTVTLTLSVNDTSVINQEMSVCETDLPLTIGTETYTSSGVYTQVYNNTKGCDSTVILTLNVLDTSLVAEELEICESLLPFTFGTQSLSAGGVYTEVFSGQNACDSTVVLTLTVKDTFVVSDMLTVCETELPVQFGATSLTAAGTYTEVFTSANGCDSTVTLQLTVNDTTLVELEETVCETELPFVLGTQSLTGSGIYTEAFAGINGCDSTVVLTLNVLDTSLVNAQVEICESDLPYSFGTQTLSGSGNFTEVYSGINGCDSTVVLTLNVLDTSIVNAQVEICESDLPYSFGTQTLSGSGNYTEVFSRINGCDSTVTLLLTVKDTSLIVQEETLCESDLPITLGTQTLTASGIYREVFAGINGCDSTVVLTLNVLDTSLVNKEVEVCEGNMPYTFGTQILTGSGNYTEVFTSANGCDSTVLLTLTVNDTIRVSASITACEKELPYIFGTQSLIADGTFTETFSTSAGCDSIVVLVFAVSDTFSSSFSDTVCENDLPYMLGTQSLTASGTYTETFAATNGCDSMVTLALTVHQSYNSNLSVTVQRSDLPYIFDTKQLTKTGIYSNTYSTVYGCDSVITLHLLVKDNIPPVVQCHSIEVELDADGTYTLSKNDVNAIAEGSADDVSIFEDLQIVITPSLFSCADIGETDISVQVSDAAGNKATCQTTVRVLAVVSDPKIDEVSNQLIDEDSTLIVLLTGISGGTQCEEWKVSLSATHTNPALISELNIEYQDYDSTAILEIIPQANQSGTDSITVSVEDSLGNSTSVSFVVTVNAVNDSPVILQLIEDQGMEAGDTISITISKLPGDFFEDFDDSNLAFNFSFGEAGLPGWVNILEETEQFVLTFTPSESDTGCFEVVVSLQDLVGAVVSDTFRICIDPLEVGIDRLEKSTFEMKLYPNPTRGFVNIDLENPPQGEIELLVTNIAGSEVFRKSYQSGERIIFDLSNHVSGPYLVILRLNEQRIVRKLILDKK